MPERRMTQETMRVDETQQTACQELLTHRLKETHKEEFQKIAEKRIETDKRIVELDHAVENLSKKIKALDQTIGELANTLKNSVSRNDLAEKIGNIAIIQKEVVSTLEKTASKKEVTREIEQTIQGLDLGTFKLGLSYTLGIIGFLVMSFLVGLSPYYLFGVGDADQKKHQEITMIRHSKDLDSHHKNIVQLQKWKETTQEELAAQRLYIETHTIIDEGTAKSLGAELTRIQETITRIEETLSVIYKKILK